MKRRCWGSKAAGCRAVPVQRTVKAYTASDFVFALTIVCIWYRLLEAAAVLAWAGRARAA